MPRFRKQATSKTDLPKAELMALVREAGKEAAEANEVSEATRLDYTAKAKQLAKGWDMGTACKQTRYAMRAAGLWTMRRQLKKLLREATGLKRKGATGAETFEEREAQWATKLGEVRALMQKIADFKDLPWNEIADPARRLQASHKQKAATDHQLKKFYEAAGESQFLPFFLVAEFSGCRGDEFARGVKVELSRPKGVKTLSFFIESAKTDGDKKGLPLRRVDVPLPNNATDEVVRRWAALAKLAAVKGGATFTLAPTEKQTVGQRFSNAVKTFATKANVDFSAYALRNRVSAQAKQSGDAESVALVLGHQTTQTQRHYARAGRGGRGVSPVAIVGVNVGGHQIRGDLQRKGPPHSVKDKVAMDKTAAKAPPSRGPRRRL